MDYVGIWWLNLDFVAIGGLDILYPRAVKEGVRQTERYNCLYLHDILTLRGLRIS